MTNTSGPPSPQLPKRLPPEELQQQVSLLKARGTSASMRVTSRACALKPTKMASSKTSSRWLRHHFGCFYQDQEGLDQPL